MLKIAKNYKNLIKKFKKTTNFLKNRNFYFNKRTKVLIHNNYKMMQIYKQIILQLKFYVKRKKIYNNKLKRKLQNWKISKKQKNFLKFRKQKIRYKY